MKQKRRRKNKKSGKEVISNAGNNSQLASSPPCVQDAVGFADLNYLYFVGGYKEPEDKMDERTILKVREVWRYNPICSEWDLLPIRLATTSSIARSQRPSQPPHRYFGSRDGVAPISTTSVGSASPLNNHTGPGFIYSLMVGETNRKQLRMVYLEADRFIDTPIVEGEPDCEDCDDCCDYYGYSFNISSSICKQGDAYPTEFYQKEVITVDHKYPYKSQIQFYKLSMNEAGEWRRSHVVPYYTLENYNKSLDEDVKAFEIGRDDEGPHLHDNCLFVFPSAMNSCMEITFDRALVCDLSTGQLCVKGLKAAVYDEHGHPQIPTNRSRFSSTVIGDKFFIVGGLHQIFHVDSETQSPHRWTSAQEVVYKEVWTLDLLTWTWTKWSEEGTGVPLHSTASIYQAPYINIFGGVNENGDDTNDLLQLLVEPPTLKILAVRAAVRMIKALLGAEARLDCLTSDIPNFLRQWVL